MRTNLFVARLVAIGLYYALVGLLAWQQRRFLYVPDRRPPDLLAAGASGARAVTVHTADGLDLLAWWAALADGTMPVVLYLHGNGGTIGHRARRFAQVSLVCRERGAQ